MCPSLESIEVDAENKYYASIDGILYNKRIDTLIACPSCNAESVLIPETVVSIADYAFYESTIRSVEIPSSVTSIGSKALYNCDNLGSVNISAANIGEYAFYDCDNVETIKIGERVKSIGDYAFCYCGSVETIEIGKSVKSIGDYALGVYDATDIYSYATTPPTCTDKTFSSGSTIQVYRLATLHIPQGTLSVYQNATAWKNFIKVVEDVEAAINNVEVDDIEMSLNVSGDGIIISGYTGKVWLYGISGELYSMTRTDGSETIITVPSSGLYIIKTEDKSRKIMVKIE